MKCSYCKHTVQVDFDKWICDLEHKEVYEGVGCSRFPMKSLFYHIKDFIRNKLVKRQSDNLYRLIMKSLTEEKGVRK